MAYYSEIVEGYQLERDAKGITGQRVFLESDTPVNISNSGVTLPKIGDIMHDQSGPSGTDTYLRLYCTKIISKFFGEDTRKKIYTCYYSNEPVDNTDMLQSYTPPTNPGDLPHEIDFSGEFQLWKASSTVSQSANYKWVWEDNQNTKIADAIPFKVRMFTFKVQKIVPEVNYAAYLNIIRGAIGKVNDTSTTVFGTLGAGCVLFTGARNELYRNYDDKRAFKFELTFAYRDPDNQNSDGWQKILNEYGEWKIPYNTGTGEKLYKTTNLNDLFN
jgi:hypothetical protein